MHRTRSLLRDESGQALVEFALVLPLLLFVLFTMLDFGKAFNYWNDATHLSAEGARYAMVNRKPDPSLTTTLQQQILAQAETAELRSGGTAALPVGAQVCIDFPRGTSQAGDPVRVTVRFTYFWMPLGDLLDKVPFSSKTVVSTSTMRLETIPTAFSAGCT